ncbi:MAG: SDR family NAD(P)-dependent oxidoreductase, partial [Geobacteraceae bacterium]
LNILTLTGFTKYFMHHMVEQGKGKILNVASTAAFLPGPFMSVYYASKAYVLSFSKALAYELKDTNVTVSVLCPGPTKTEFQDRAGVQNSALFSGKRMPVSTAREVAQAGFNGLMKGKTVIIPGLLNRIGVVGSRFSPSSVTNRMVEELHRSR